ncbi:hypothetical protein KP509_30G047800 [Ceratopteris richardii]|uniref:Uncharacterized protein n=1 Tax=Ceratopteris richardii TaxID=49495 RepID=A0A8T2R337_CERRI|nr:hypothetical protein KP509_30G047800 [Ceratopteris richardii]
MVKLVAARTHRRYGPHGVQDAFEITNAVVYLVATIFFIGGMTCLLINFTHPLQYKEAHPGLILLAIAICLIILVNLHDILAHLAGIDFRLELLSYDPQLIFIEIAAPLVYVIGAVLYLIAIVFMLQSKSLVQGRKEQAAVQLLVAGSVFWVLGSIHNACQLYSRSSPLVQFLQKAVYQPLLIASTLLLIGSVLWFKGWPNFILARSAQYGAITIGIIAAALMVLGAIINIFRVLYLRRLVGSYAHAPLDTLWGRAHEELEAASTSRLQPLLEQDIPSEESAPGPLPPPPKLHAAGPPLPGAAPGSPQEPPIVEEETFAVIR